MGVGPSPGGGACLRPNARPRTGRVAGNTDILGGRSEDAECPAVARCPVNRDRDRDRDRGAYPGIFHVRTIHAALARPKETEMRLRFTPFLFLFSLPTYADDAKPKQGPPALNLLSNSFCIDGFGVIQENHGCEVLRITKNDDSTVFSQCEDATEKNIVVDSEYAFVPNHFKNMSKYQGFDVMCVDTTFTLMRKKPPRVQPIERTPRVKPVDGP
jgi:hypothetical protein